MDLTSLIVAVHRENFGDRDGLEDRIAELLKGYDLEDSAPRWIVELFCAVNSHSSSESLFGQVGSDIGSVLLELSEDFGWIGSDTGEEIRMSFPISKMNVIISREALAADGTSCCSYRVTTAAETDRTEGER